VKIFVIVITLTLLLSGIMVVVRGEDPVRQQLGEESIEENETQATQEIHDWHDLNNTRDNLDGDYVLMNDLDEDTAGYEELVNTTDGWNPIGDGDYLFTGTFDGQEHEIDGLNINRPSHPYGDGLGLFGNTHEDAIIKNVGLLNVNITGSWAGGLVGHNEGGEIQNSYASGKVTGVSRLGGLIGVNRGTVSHSYSMANVSGEYYQIGGLVGFNNGVVTESYSKSEVSGEEWVGGLVGWKRGDISSSYATGGVTGNERVGGLVGFDNWGITIESYATGEVSGGNKIGGLVGYMDIPSVIDSYSTGNVSGEESIGGLVGYNDDGSINRSYSVGYVEGDTYIGGLVGWNLGNIDNSFWDIETSGINTSNGGTGKITQEMKDLATYTDETTEGLEESWDFVCNPYNDDGEENIWNLDGYHQVNDGYPFLNWQDVELGKYELTVDSTEGGEVIIPGENTFEYEQWSEVDLEAVAYEGYQFEEWIGDNETLADTTSNKNTIIMEGNYTLTAHFEEMDKYDLTINAGEGGTTNPVPGTYTYYTGTQVTVSSIPEIGYELDGWTGDYESEEEEITVTVDQNITITAHFKLKEYNLTIDTIGEGDVEVEPDQSKYEHGTEVNLTANPVDNWYFENWTEDYTGTENQITITMDEDKEITAFFKEYEPYFEVEITDYDDKVREDEEVTIKYTVTNTGKGNGTQDIILRIDDEEEVIKENLTLKTGQEHNDKFTFTPEGDVGEYEIKITSDEGETVMIEVEERHFLLENWWLLPLLVVGGIIGLILLRKRDMI